MVFLAAGLEAARQGFALGLNLGTVANIRLSAAHLANVACASQKAAKPALQDDAFTMSSGDAWTGRA